MIKYGLYCLLLLLFLPPTYTLAQNRPAGKLAPKPLYRDPIYDGAADPVVIWNKQEKKWFMFYTNRRATDPTADGVTWVHGTRIGIAESMDGATWTYRDTANINYRPSLQYTHWAPDVAEDTQGGYHMFLTYVPGIFTDWNHPRAILHLTSADLLNWKYESTLALTRIR
jgi:sucrose-6-phosphate hydrolase SacC (GH32 family)